MTHEQFKLWRTATMSYTQQQAADALGVSLPTLQSLERGATFKDNRPLEIDKRTALACAALAEGLKPL
ncbi:hypothetical protein [Janthinobacterium sp. B9-8]|uniref:hypothetical protein n=1 Tax=Janthinobacterium sp. B9-8 TaxID=1236179 RepID=UPI00061D065F|nr:hypothetical protein [Janthinobacterium sp. B9-8]AMC34742.1 hypothetical protein VN23_09035 [Janthinobacterium sp. B9-8]